MKNRHLAGALLLTVLLASSARAETKLPEKRPADARLSFHWGGGMTGASTAVVVSSGGGHVAECPRHDLPTWEFTFEPTAQDLDALYAVIRENGLDSIERSEGIVYDKPGVSVSVQWGRESVHASDSGCELTESSQPRFAKIAGAFWRYVGRLIAEHETDLVLTADESLTKRGAKVRLDDHPAMGEHGRRGYERVLPGEHVLRISMPTSEPSASAPESRVELRLALNVSGPRGVKLSAKGDKVLLEDFDPARTLVKIPSKDAATHGLPAASIALDLGETGMSPMPFPESGSYFTASGPPGGPQGVELSRYTGTAGEEAALADLAAKKYAKRYFVKGTFETVEIHGRSHVALSCATDGGHAHSAHLLVLFPARSGGTEGVLVDYTVGLGEKATVPTPTELMKLERHGDVLQSIHVHFD